MTEEEISRLVLDLKFYTEECEKRDTLLTQAIALSEKHWQMVVELEDKVEGLVKSSFREGFLACAGDGWMNNPRIEEEWECSSARSLLSTTFEAKT